MRISTYEKETASSLISKIDSEEAILFLQIVETGQKIVAYRFFEDDSVVGVFVGFIFNDTLRIQISFSDDAGQYKDELVDLVNQSLSESDTKNATIWLWNENKEIISGLKESFSSDPKNASRHYASIEFMMRRESFVPVAVAPLDVRGYDEDHIDRYLQLLDESMDFVVPPPQHLQNKAIYRTKFEELHQKESFEAFWIATELVGLYWRSDAHINVIAVATKKLRNGHGRRIISRAFDRVFKNTDAVSTYLYCVDWNEKAIRFYEKIGMLRNGHSYRLQIE